MSARTGEWLVMDGRARFDPDEAVVLEALGHGHEDWVPRKQAKHWRNHDACLCFAPHLGGEQCGAPEYREDV